MTANSFTPGPWKWEGSIYERMSTGIRSIPDDRGIGQLWQHANVVADAKLIAAAPDLYEACRYIVEAGEDGDEMKAIEMARAALAKVTL